MPNKKVASRLRYILILLSITEKMPFCLALILAGKGNCCRKPSNLPQFTLAIVFLLPLKGVRKQVLRKSYQKMIKISFLPVSCYNSTKRYYLLSVKFFSRIKKNTIYPLLFLLVIALAAFLRLLFLDRIPNTITPDELTYLLNIKAVILTGRGLMGVWNPWSVLLFHYPPGQIQAELPFFLYLPAVGFGAFSLFSAHITNALLSLLSVGLVFLVGERMINKNTGLAAAFLAAINPWFIYIGRTAYEVVPATLFFLLLLYMLCVLRKWKILLVIPVMILAFYSYIATKTVLFPFVLVVTGYVYFYRRKKEDGLYYLAVLFFAACFTLAYLLLLILHPESSRLGEILTPFSGAVAGQVDLLRKDSIQTLLVPLLINKFSVFLTIMLAKLFAIFSPTYLFATGDSFFAFWNHGIFYAVDGLFLILGTLFMFEKQKKIFIFLVSLIFIGIFPQLLHGQSSDNFTPHIALAIQFLLLLMGYGIVSGVTMLNGRVWRCVGVAIIGVVYLVSITGFMNNYLYQNSLQGKTAFTARVLSRYLAEADRQGLEVNVYSPRQTDIFLKYLFYANAYNKGSISAVQNALVSRNITLGSIHFKTCNPAFAAKPGIISIYDNECGNPKNILPHHAIKQLSDSGDSYLIYNDRICRLIPLSDYVSNVKISDFLVESLSRSAFCKAFVFN